MKGWLLLGVAVFVLFAASGCVAEEGAQTDEQYIKTTEAEIKGLARDLALWIQGADRLGQERPKLPGIPTVPTMCLAGNTENLSDVSLKWCLEKLERAREDGKRAQEQIESVKAWQRQNAPAISKALDRFADLHNQFLALEEKIKARHQRLLPQWVKDNPNWRYAQATFAGPLLEETIRELKEQAEAWVPTDAAREKQRGQGN